MEKKTPQENHKESDLPSDSVSQKIGAFTNKEEKPKPW